MPREPAVRRVAEVLKCAAHPSRVVLLMSLRGGDVHLADVYSRLPDVGPFSLNYHLKHLRLGGLVQSRREGPRSVLCLTARGRLVLKVVDALG